MKYLFLIILLLISCVIICAPCDAKVEVSGSVAGAQVMYGHKPDGSITPIVLDSNNRVIVVSS